MRRQEIEEQNAFLLQQQNDFRAAADIVTKAFARFEEVEAVAVIGSVVKPLWKEVPRFPEYRRAGIEVWHECMDLDLAVWLGSLDRLGRLRRAKDIALRRAYEAGQGPSVASHQVEVFLIEPESDRYLGRLCSYNACPKHKPPCAVPGCGAVPFNQVIEGFEPYPDFLAPAAHATLYRRGQGILMSALDLPEPEGQFTGSAKGSSSSQT